MFFGEINYKHFADSRTGSSRFSRTQNSLSLPFQTPATQATTRLDFDKFGGAAPFLSLNFLARKPVG